MLGFAQFGKNFWNKADFAGDDGPAVGGEPFGDGCDFGAFADKFCAGGVFGDVVVLLARQGLDFVGSGFDGGCFEVDIRIGVVRFDEADVIEDELVGAGRGELAFAEEDANFGGGSIYVVGVNFDDYGDVVRCAAFVDEMVQRQLFVADAGAFVDGTLDGILGNAFFFRFLDGGKKPGVGCGICIAHPGGESDFAHELGVGLGLFKAGNQSFCV